MKALTKVRRFLVSEDGPTAVEYAVMLALILVACITIVTTLGTSVSGTFSRVNASMSELIGDVRVGNTAAAGRRLTTASVTHSRNPFRAMRRR